MCDTRTGGTCYQQTLCWDCANATGSCSWSDHNEHAPVDGWEAIPTKVKMHTGRDMVEEDTNSYIVLSCPEFIRDGEGHGARRIGGDSQQWHRAGEKEKQAIIQAYECGVKVREICDATGYTETAIYKILKRNGIKMNRETGRKSKPTPAWQGPRKEDWT